MKKLAVLISAALVAGSFVSTSALADAYIGGKLGYSWLEDECSVSNSCDDDAVGYGVFGGYNFNDYLGLEASYDMIGDFIINNGTNFSDDKLKALSLSPKVNFAISDAISVFGKIGAAYMDYGDDNSTVLTGGVGAEYALSKSTALRLEYQRFENIDSDFVKDDFDANFVSLGLQYKFGQNPAYVAPVVAAAAVIAAEPEPEPTPTLVTKEAKKIVESNTFANDSSKLTDGSIADLSDVIDTLKAYPQAQAMVVGHADSTGKASYNQQLSEERANKVADYIVNQGVSKDQLVVSGAGEGSPIADNKTKEGRAKNRRVEVTIPSFEYQEKVMK